MYSNLITGFPYKMDTLPRDICMIILKYMLIDTPGIIDMALLLRTRDIARLLKHPTPGEYASQVLIHYICDITKQKVIYNIFNKKYKNIKLRKLTEYDITVSSTFNWSEYVFILRKYDGGKYNVVVKYWSFYARERYNLYNNDRKYEDCSYMGCIKQILMDFNYPGDLITINGILYDISQHIPGS